MKGKRIRSLDGLMAASRARRAVLVELPGYTMRTAAAFIVGMQARVVHMYIQYGMYLYKKETPSAK
jgi:hypothetical protein